MFTAIEQRIRAGKGPFWGGAKRLVRAALSFHLPVNSVTSPVFGLLYRIHVAAREGMLAVLRLVWFEPLFRSQCEAVGRRFRMEYLPYLGGSGRIVIGDRVRLSGKSGFMFTSHVVPRPELRIGDGSFVGHGCGFSVARSVVIGRNCLIAGGVSIRDFDGHPLDAAARRAGEFVRAEDVQSVTLGDDVWVGAGATVLKGVSIGDRAVVAAGSTVVRDVPADTVVAGVPAVVVKRLADQQSDAGASL